MDFAIAIPFVNYRETVVELFNEFFNLFDIRDLTNRKIIIKVNLVNERPYPFTTHSSFAFLVANELKKRVHKAKILIADGSGGTDTLFVARKFDYLRLPFRFIDLNRERVYRSYNEKALIKNYLIPQILKDSFLISLANTKQHPEAVYSGCVKNIFGIVRRSDYQIRGRGPKRKLHYPSIEENIVSLFLHKPFDLGILDSVVGCTWGRKREEIGKPIFFKEKLLLIGSPFKVDLVGIRQLGLNINQVPHLRLFEKIIH